jgi:hypothetical protein
VILYLHSLIYFFGGEMRNKTVIAIVAILIFLVQAACAVGGIIPTQAPGPTQDVNALVSTGIALTAAANQFQMPTNTQQAVIIIPPANTNTPEPVLPTNTTAPAISGVINYGANCRSGPGANFPAQVVLDKGTAVSVVGTNKATDKTTWWVVQVSGKPDCWVIDDAVTITGDKASVVVVVSPATPTPIPPPSWDGVWTMWIEGGYEGTSGSGDQIRFTQTGTVLTTAFNMWGYEFTFLGYVSADGMSANGTLTRTVDNAKFPVVFLRIATNLNQFKGSWISGGLDGNWCGAKNGAGKPDPCWAR